MDSLYFLAGIENVWGQSQTKLAFLSALYKENPLGFD